MWFASIFLNCPKLCKRYISVFLRIDSDSTVNLLSCHWSLSHRHVPCSRFPGQPLFLVSKSSSRLKMLTLVIHRKWNTMFLSLILLWCFIFWLYRYMYWNIIMYCFRKTKPKQNKKSKWEKFERLILRHTVLLSVRRG